MKFFVLVFMVLFLFSSHSRAERFGAGIVGLATPHYMGADEHYNLVFPIPLFSSMFDEKKEKSMLIIEFDADLNLPIGSQAITDTDKSNGFYDFDNYARRGMDSIPATFYFGGKVGIRLKAIELSFSVAPGLQLGKNWNGAGLRSRAEIVWHVKKLGATEFIIVVKAMWTDKKYNKIYYEVEDKDVINGRERYSSRSGYLGSSLALHYHTWKPVGSLIFGFFLEYQNMKNSIVEDSPLVVNNHNLQGGLGFGFFF